jgi:cyclase
MKKNVRFMFFLLSMTIFIQVSCKAQSSNGARLENLDKGVYTIIHDDATDEWPHGNTGVIVGEDAVMVIDACYLPSMAKEDIRLIQTVTKKPVKYLAFTHWHFDHNNGAMAYKEAFPDITIISESASQKWVELNAIWWSKMSAANNSYRRQSLAKLEAELTSGKDAEGVPLTPLKVATLKKVIAQRQNELSELSTLKVIKPNKTFDQELTIDLGKRKVQLVNQGKGNSPADVTIYLPAEQILFTGDLLVQSPLPYLSSSWPLPWVKVLENMEKMPIKKMVLGHGPVQTDHSYTKKVRTFLETAISRVEALLLEGKTPDEIKRDLDLNDLRNGVWGDEKDKSDWKLNSDILVDRVMRGVRGQG